MLSERPKVIPIGRPRGVKALGLRYERELAKVLSGARRGVWFEFEDSRGHGFCQVDFLVPVGGRPVVLEAKYTWTLEGHEELEGLYLPVMRGVRGLERALGLVVCKKLTEGTLASARSFGDLTSAVEWAEGGERAVLHWIGNGPLLLRAQGAHFAFPLTGRSPHVPLGLV